MASVPIQSVQRFLARILSVVLPFGRRTVRRRGEHDCCGHLAIGRSGLRPAVPLGGGESGGLCRFEFWQVLSDRLFNITDPQQLVYVTGTLAIISLVVASASTIVSQIIVARYVGRSRPLATDAAAFQVLQPALLVFCLAQLCSAHKKGEYGRLHVHRLSACAALRFCGKALHHRSHCCRTAGA